MSKKDNSKKIGLTIVIILIIGIIFYIQNPFDNSNEQRIAELKNTEDTGLNIGNTAPDFFFENTNAASEALSIQLSGYRGQKAVIINFWASWCPPCREEFPAFEEIYLEKKQDVEIIGVNLQEDPGKIHAFADEFAISFPLLLDPDSSIKELYGVFTQPVTYFINQEGIIVDKKFGPLTESELEEKVAKLGIK